MIWVVVFALIVSVALNILFAVLVSRQSSHVLLVLDRSHERTVEYTKDLLNRLMVKDWPQYMDLNAAVPDLDDGDDEPSVPALVAVLGPDRGGFGSRHGLRGWAEPEETINPEDDMP